MPLPGPLIRPSQEAKVSFQVLVYRMAALVNRSAPAEQGSSWPSAILSYIVFGAKKELVDVAPRVRSTQVKSFPTEKLATLQRHLQEPKWF